MSNATLARRLVSQADAGILSTHSAELDGYPFGSVTPFALLPGGDVALFVSAIAEHTTNMRANPRVCLTVTEEGGGNRQALGRVSIVGDAAPASASALESVEGRYFRLFPEARAYREAHAFEFFAITPRRVRYIAGFGRIHWVEPDEWRLPVPGWDEEGVLAHMNDDHADAVRSIARKHGARSVHDAAMIAVDVEGCHVRADGVRYYAPFEQAAPSSEELRQAMIALA